jgi:hypothetical protein
LSTKTEHLLRWAGRAIISATSLQLTGVDGNSAVSGFLTIHNCIFGEGAMTSGGTMTYQQAQALLKKLVQAKDRDELQQIISNNIGSCDGVFFAELEAMVERYRERGDERSARSLKELGDYMARLRFMI